ncbi:alanine aminotransferase 2-like [Solea senegalensis]|uniref:alanine transaminase n=1 Tax=Solea senegalensis TaxID=28829 RepID=A0AAV6SDG9_SOLSE|nr:alanine aminotransferase 2-like [Solea senegalensis]
MTSLQQVNPRVLAIRESTGLQTLAAHITQQITQGGKRPFQKVTDVSSHDPQEAGMAPISFVRQVGVSYSSSWTVCACYSMFVLSQVLAMCQYPELLKDEHFPLDARQRAQKLLGWCSGGSVGSYTPTSNGTPQILETIADFITRRDGGVRSHPENIIFSTGSQKIFQLLLHLMSCGSGGSQTGMLIPTPCPHTLLSLMDESEVKTVPYQLMEERGWAVDLDKLHQALKAARGHCEPRAIYICNPGNPTGHVQDRETIEQVIRFAATEGLVLLAHEVHQDSVYGQDKQFVSYKKVLFEMEKKYSEAVELISIHSISTACAGECGLRGAYMEVVNVDPPIMTYVKRLQITTCPPVLSHFAMHLMVNPPTPGDLSYGKYAQEILQRQKTLSQNARRACDFLNALPGMSCQPAMGGVFLYPRLQLSSHMIEEAKTSGVEADVFYCQRFLEEEGVCLGPGCENGHDDQNYHVRLCVLVPPVSLDQVLARLRSFHLRLLEGSH